MTETIDPLLRDLLAWRGHLLETAVLRSSPLAPAQDPSDEEIPAGETLRDQARAGDFADARAHAARAGRGASRRTMRDDEERRARAARSRGASIGFAPATPNHGARVTALFRAAEAAANPELRAAGASADERLNCARNAETGLMRAEEDLAALGAALSDPRARVRIRAVRIYHDARIALASALRERAIVDAVTRGAA